MNEHALEPEDVIQHLHRLLTTGRLLLDESVLCELRKLGTIEVKFKPHLTEDKLEELYT